LQHSVELLRLVDLYTLAEFKRAPEAPQYREVLRLFGSWSRAKSLCGGWAGLGAEACFYRAEVEPGIVKIGTCSRRGWLLGHSGTILETWCGPVAECIAREVAAKLHARVPVAAPARSTYGPGGYYLSDKSS
jgi:hypothetical protein